MIKGLLEAGLHLFTVRARNAHLPEIRQLKLSQTYKTYSHKTWFIKVLFLCQKCSNAFNFNSKKFWMLYPRIPVKRGRRWKGRGGEGLRQAVGGWTGMQL